MKGKKIVCGKIIFVLTLDDIKNIKGSLVHMVLYLTTIERHGIYAGVIS